VRVIKEAVREGYARRTGDKDLAETDRDFVFGIKLTEEGRHLLDRVLRLGEPRATPAAIAP
jgi:hypothetical protein